MTGAEPTDQVDEAWTEEVSSPEQTAESVGKDGALRQELEQRQAIIRRQQGETFLLATQVKQLEQQVTEASRDAQACSAQLAQVLQLMDSTGGRVPLKGEVDRARALVTAARRAIRRVACWSEGEPPHSSRGERSSVTGAQHGVQHGHAQASAAPRSNGYSQSDRRPSPLGSRPRSPRGDLPGRDRDGREVPGLAASAVAAVGDAADGKPAANGVSPGAVGKPERPAGRSKGPKDAKDGPRGRRPRERASTGGQSDPETPRVPAVASESTAADSVHALSAQLAEVQQACLRQRELLLRAVRRGAQLEDSVSSMKDEVTRKDVIIHNLRQDMSGQQQELKQQQLQFEQHVQQIQQAHLQQLQQQACQIQELQLLQIQHLQKAQIPEEAVDAAPSLPNEPSFGT
ncbi:unnamed protein product [Effrenium voratum]|uniref:Uncharacterized protein n=1 Tax=Effrenium voratum TaxID=2562239 RepID=A0AA36NCZ2_9DINO|nr:unnamed protein product [Effrenium voratum]CAJ1447473.1 unnamed protein product [Effrenium voratum]